MDIIIDYSKVYLESSQVLEKCFTKYKLNEIFVAFNGGKDCTVLLDLIVDILSGAKFENCDIKSLVFVYIQPEYAFTELEEFIFSIKEHYDINLSVMPGNIKDVLENMLNKNSNIKACLMGTRSTDPYSGHLDFFTMTDPAWPQIMRVSPLLNWSYQEIWSYLLDRKVPYCKLYDLGYTSLGNTKNTTYNPSLKVVDPSNNAVVYKPAYYLKDTSLERDGRIDIKK